MLDKLPDVEDHLDIGPSPVRHWGRLRFVGHQERCTHSVPHQMAAAAADPTKVGNNSRDAARLPAEEDMMIDAPLSLSYLFAKN